jgi:PAS domain S-box-containing protein
MPNDPASNPPVWQKIRPTFTNYVVLSADGVVLAVNDGPLAAAGLRREQVVGKPFPDTPWFAGNPAVRAQVAAALERAQRGEAVRFDLTGLAPDGPLAVVDVFFGPLVEPGGLTRIVATFSDIVQRNRDATAIVRNEARLREAERIAHLGHWERDLRDHSRVWSDEVFRLFGLQPGEIALTNSAVETLIHPDDRARIAAATEAAVQRRAPYDLVYRIVRRDGTERTLHSRAEVFRDDTGRPVRMFGTVYDVTDRERLHAELAHSAALLAATLESTTDGIMALDRDCLILHTNRRLLEMWQFGLPRENARDGRAFREQMFALMTDPAAARAHTAAIDADPQCVAHGRFELRDGRIFERFTRPMFTGGTVTGRVCSFRDVTETTRAAAALQASEAKFAGILDIADEAVITIDAAQRIVLFNQGAEKIFGYSSEEMLGQPLMQLLPVRHMAAHAGQVAAFGAGGDTTRAMTARSGPIEGRRKDGTIFPAEVSITKLALPDGLFFTAILRDITERRRTEAARDQSLSLMRATLESTADGIVAVDLTGRIITHNALFTQMSGLSADVLKDANILEIWKMFVDRLVDPQGIYEKTKGLQARPHLESHDLLLFKDGRAFERFSRPQLLNGRTVGRVVSFRDVTAARHAEAERKQLEEQLRQSQKLEAVGTLAGGLAHDFNNILTGILGYAQLAGDEEPGGPDPRECVREITAAAQRAADLVGQLLSFSRHQPQDRELVQLNEIVRESVKFLRPVLPASIELRQVLPPASPTILANATQIQQVILNLCTNARQALGGRTGFIELRLEAVEIGGEFARLHPGLHPGRFARLTVADNGPGMTRAVLARIFEPFYTTKPPGQGSGLGLSAVHGIMLSHDGTVTVASEPGQGTTFQLHFPALETLGAASEAPVAPQLRGRGERILFVDDEEALAELGLLLLARLGYRITVERDPSAALATFLQSPAAFDAAVLDFAMPGLTGLDLARHLRQIRPDLPIMIMSGNPNAIPTDELGQIGVTEVLAKPGTVASLGASLGRIFGGRGV